jgi:hypothetical protein
MDVKEDREFEITKLKKRIVELEEGRDEEIEKLEARIRKLEERTSLKENKRQLLHG